MDVSKNPDLRLPKNSDPWVSRKLIPPKKKPKNFRPLGVSKSQKIPGCLENSDPLKVHLGHWKSRKCRNTKHMNFERIHEYETSY